MPYLAVLTYTFTVPQSAIDEYGHVNNVIYVQWMQDAAIRHGEAITEYQLAENTGWFAREHRIEYLAPAYAGDEIEVRTWLVEMKRVRDTASMNSPARPTASSLPGARRSGSMST